LVYYQCCARGLKREHMKDHSSVLVSILTLTFLKGMRFSRYLSTFSFSKILQEKTSMEALPPFSKMCMAMWDFSITTTPVQPGFSGSPSTTMGPASIFIPISAGSSDNARLTSSSPIRWSRTPSMIRWMPIIPLIQYGKRNYKSLECE